MELDWSKKRLFELVEKAYVGEVMLPDFQRNFLWTRNDIEELISSLLEQMFIGTFLIQRVDPKHIPFKVIPIEGANLVNKSFAPKPEVLVLDGQQRITSLFYALYAPDIPLKNTANPYAFFIDLGDLGRGEIEEAVFSWSKQWREYKSLLNNNGDYEISQLRERKILPLNFLADGSFFWKLWYEHLRSSFSEKEALNIENYIKNLMEYQAYVLSIPLNEKPEDIAKLFERINRTGVKLSIFDLLTARMYKFINLRHAWEEAYESSYYIRQLSNNDVKNTKIPYYIIQGIALSRDMSVKAKDMIKIDADVLNTNSWHKAVTLLEQKVLKRLFDVSEYGIAGPQWLSYPSMISVWLGLFLKSEAREIQVDIEKINKWYWSVIFTERYSGSTETKHTKDFKDLIAWLLDSSRVPEAVLDMNSKLEILKLQTKYAGSSIYKGVFNLLFKKKAQDFLERDVINFSSLEDHHIFPRKFLESKRANVEKDIVLNRTLITSVTNRKIGGKAPAAYIRDMIESHGSESAVKAILAKHFIDSRMYEILKSSDETLSPEEIGRNFSMFISMREDLIKQEIKQIMSL